MRVLWSAYARTRREEIFDYISSDNADAALHLDESFSRCARLLESHPNIGRTGRIEGTRELVVQPHYVLVYEVGEDSVEILTIQHTSRRYPLTAPARLHPKS